MAEQPGLARGGVGVGGVGGVGGDDSGSIVALLERVSGLMESVQATQQRMEARQQEVEAAVRSVQADVVKLAGDHAHTGAAVHRLLDKTRSVSRHVKDVRVRLENQNLRVKKVEATQGDLLAKNKFRVVIYQGDQEVKSVAPGNEPAGPGARADIEPDKFELPPESDEEYMVVEEAESSAAGRAKKTGLTRIESFKATFSKENMNKTRENLGTKVNKLGERIVTAERREKIRQSGERLKETISKSVPAKLKKERTVAEGQEGATDGKAGEAEVPMYDMKQLS